MADTIRSYQDLIAWQRAFELGKAAYALAGKFPDFERFGLVSTIRRTSVNIASHIAQGYGRGNTQDYLWFLKQARGEVYVLDTQLLFALDFKYLDADAYDAIKSLLDETERVLAGLIRSVSSSS